jgi:hypothetical protein
VTQLAPQKSVPPAGSVVFSGPGWKAAIPVGVLIAVVAAFGSTLAQRAVPDSALQKIETQLQIKALEDSQFRHEIRRDLAAIQQQINRNDQDTRNRFAVLEARLRDR